MVDKELRVAWMADIFDEVSGVITDTEEMYEQARKHDIFWQPVTTYPKELYPFHRFKHLFKIPLGTFYRGSWAYVPDFFKVTRYLKENNINVVVSNTPGIMGMVAMASARYLRLPWVDIYHTDIDFYMDVLSVGPLRPFVNRTALMVLKQYQKRADLIFVRTQQYFDLKVKKGHPPEKLRFYPAGVNIEHWRPENRDPEVWRKFGIDPDKFIVLYVGRITRVKDILYLLEAFAQQGLHDAELVLVGSGPEKELYEEQYGSLPNVHFLGIRRGEELQKIYASSDLYVLPSASETLGKTVLEAMASGTPVLVSDQGGPKDYVTPGVNGEIFRAYDYEHFCSQLNALIQKGKEIGAMGKESRETTYQYTDESLFNSFVTNIKELI